MYNYEDVSLYHLALNVGLVTTIHVPDTYQPRPAPRLLRKTDPEPTTTLPYLHTKCTTICMFTADTVRVSNRSAPGRNPALRRRHMYCSILYYWR